ncbi:hypothetical protein BDR04DRAFT_1124923 [Suillus decipiens]|nr:hypothetical protein BDR04DRAFT_1124923 [Suillus decipiens]
MPSIRIRKTPSTYALLPARFDNDIEALPSRSLTLRGQQSMGNIPRPTTTHNAQMDSTPGNKQRSRSHTTSGVSQTDIPTHSQLGVRTPSIVESAPEVQQSQQLDESVVHDDIVDHLDAIDPQVATVSSLANAANSILMRVPPSSFYSRKPVIALFYPSGPQGYDVELAGNAQSESDDMDESLDRHVKDVLTGRSKVKRTLQGIITGIYGFLVVFWGAALVLFLLKWINLHNANTQGFWVEVCSQIVCGLFTITGIGLIPTRALDTYRICKIWHYKHKTTKLRDRDGLPQLSDVDDLPDPAYDPTFVHVLTEREQQDLHHQQVKFRESQTWYRPHGTVTHRAFPIKFERPAWTTGSLIPASFLCGIISAILIWRGGRLTRRTEKIENDLRTALAINNHNGPLRVSSINISTNSPKSPAIVEEMTKPTMK